MMPYAYKYENEDGTTYLSLSEGFIEHIEKRYALQSDGPEITLLSWSEGGEDDA